MKRISINSRDYSFGKGMILLARAIMVAGFLFKVVNGVSQNAPVLTIASTGTNQLQITIANGTNTVSYEIWTTPKIANQNYPWTMAAVGTNNQTNFIVKMPYPTSFYRAILDTNALPLWEAADPNNQSTGILNVWIDNPVNGTTLN